MRNGLLYITMSRKRYVKEKKESFFSKFVNFVLTIAVACAIGSQVCTAANNNLRIAQVSDAHFSTFEENTSYKFLKNSAEILDDVILQINTSGAYDFVIFTGDLVNKPKVSELNSFIKHISKLAYPWYAIDGNHDISIDGPLNKEKFMEILHSANDDIPNKPYYAFTPKRGYRVICLDSIIDYKITTNGELSDEQLAWLKEELNDCKKDIVVLCIHVPLTEPYPSSDHNLLNEAEVKQVLKTHKNPIIVLQGHYHAAKVKQDGNVLYISTPSLVTYPNAFRVVNINSNKNKVLVDVFLKETNLKDLQTRSKLRLLNSSLTYGDEKDRNATYELKKYKE